MSRKLTPKQAAAIKWLYSYAPKLKSKEIPEEAFHVRKGIDTFIGGMYVYGYDPKHKDTLPWWDALPLVIPIELYKDGWLGLNLHYLPPKERKQLLETLLTFKRRAGTRKAYMKVSYEFLRGLIKAKWLEPCLHRYLASHVISRVLRVDDAYWEQVTELPIAKWNKAKAAQVYSGTKKRVKRKK